MQNDPSFYVLFSVVVILLSSDKLWQKIVLLVTVAVAAYLYYVFPEAYRLLCLVLAIIGILQIVSELAFRKKIYNSSFPLKKYIYDENSLVNEASLKDIGWRIKITYIILFAGMVGIVIWFFLT
jgi:hypothetical protein